MSNTANITFIIGAGASKELGLPLGSELKNTISKLLDIRVAQTQISGDPDILKTLQIHIHKNESYDIDMSRYLTVCRHISDALPQAISIDNFIDAHRDDKKISLCGKLGIVKSILDAERKSPLYLDNNGGKKTINFSKIENTWYTSFFQLVTENCQKNELSDRFKNITLIIFNYDRCIEHFLYYALINYYRATGKEAADIISSIKIIHPYGSVGRLPWQTGNHIIDFGKAPSPNDLLSLVDQINTFTQGAASPEIEVVKNEISISHKVIFLGFAFHKLNMKMIRPNTDTKNHSIRCFASTYGISSHDTKVVKSDIKSLFSKPIQVDTLDGTCNDFLKNFWKSISF